ncbi:hypothetical protein RF641_01565 [Arthrobacter sp. LS16]|uniref:hypothetical protein n=1 Tax=Arthrobacter sp. 'calajunan' TaxID=1690248 RepID=UPI003C7254BC
MENPREWIFVVRLFDSDGLIDSALFNAYYSSALDEKFVNFPDEISEGFCALKPIESEVPFNNFEIKLVSVPWAKKRTLLPAPSFRELKYSAKVDSFGYAEEKVIVSGRVTS